MLFDLEVSDFEESYQEEIFILKSLQVFVQCVNTENFPTLFLKN